MKLKDGFYASSHGIGGLIKIGENTPTSRNVKGVAQ